eukprot:5996403-Pleurochrysis_carterae.AAC.1
MRNSRKEKPSKGVRKAGEDDGQRERQRGQARERESESGQTSRSESARVCVCVMQETLLLVMHAACTRIMSAESESYL